MTARWPRSASARRLYQVLSERFDLDELEALAQSLGCRWDDLRGTTLPVKSASLIRWAEQRDALWALVAAVGRARPDVDWREPRGGGGLPALTVIQ